MNIFRIHLSNTDLWLLAIAGACLTLLITHRLNYWRESEARRIAACVKFRTTILTELAGLYPSPTEWPTDKRIIQILEAKFPVLQAAVTEFSITLPWYKRFFFFRAWNTYRLGKNWQGEKYQNYSQYYPRKFESFESGVCKVIHDSTTTYQSSFLNNIKRLLSYAT